MTTATRTGLLPVNMNSGEIEPAKKDTRKPASASKLTTRHLRPAEHPDAQVSQALDPQPDEQFNRSPVSSHVPAVSAPYCHRGAFTLYLGDAGAVMRSLVENSIDCIVTSPPYYGQRDYGVEGQLGLELHPQHYIDKLVAVFHEARRVLKPRGSLWVNIGDTYWSGKGKPHGPDHKQKHRRFDRPQDRSGPRPWCGPKQLLLIPHRFAIAMQNDGWIVRNDNVWHKPSPTPDPVDDRCAMAHEYVFHFVKQRRYHFCLEAVAVDSAGKRTTKPPPSVWTVATVPSKKTHVAVFPDQLVMLPILATLPNNGVLLDPFCGSGTALLSALRLGGGRRAIGIDISRQALNEAVELLHQA